jgi:hypothetical protein
VYAVKNHYWYQMYIDDLPIWGKDPLSDTFWALLKPKTLEYVLVLITPLLGLGILKWNSWIFCMW